MINITSRFYNKNNIKNRKFDVEKQNFFLKPNDTIFPLGGCFLDCFAYYLHKSDYKICTDNKRNKPHYKRQFRFFHGNFVNPLNLLDNLERIILKKWVFKECDYLFSKPFNTFINLFLKARVKTNKLEYLKRRIEEIDKYLLSEIKNAKVIILSFETNEAWVDKKSGKAWYTFYGNYVSQVPYKKLGKFVSMNFNQTYNSLNKIIKLIEKLGKKKNFILLSPPQSISETYLNQDIKISDNYSKSVLSAVLYELSKRKNISYFPAFEILNMYPKSKVLDHDHRHISIAIKKYLINIFKQMYLS